MDVDDGTAAAADPTQTVEVDEATQQPGTQQQQQQARDLRASVKTPELQTTLPHRQAANSKANGANGNQNGNVGNAGNANGNALSNHPQLQPRGSQVRESSPGHIPPFDWEEFEGRYERALADMNGEEKELLEEFEQLVNYFNVWASAASAHDDERAIKRLQTRERYVRIAEQSLGQRKQHLTEVVRAFQSALALLSQP